MAVSTIKQQSFKTYTMTVHATGTWVTIPFSQFPNGFQVERIYHVDMPGLWIIWRVDYVSDNFRILRLNTSGTDIFIDNSEADIQLTFFYI